MTLNNINVEETVQQVANLLATEQGLSPALKGSLEMLLLLVSLLLNRLGLNSSNSSKPPSTDPYRKKGVSTSLQLFFMTASMAWRPWSQCPDMWSALFAQPAQQVGEKEALGLWQSGG